MGSHRSNSTTPNPYLKFANTSNASRSNLPVEEVNQEHESSMIHHTQQSSIFASEKALLVAQLKNQQFYAIKKETEKLLKVKRKEDAKSLKMQ